VAVSCEHCSVTSGSITCSEFCDEVSSHEAFKEEFNLNRPAIEVHLRAYLLGYYATLVFCSVIVNELRCIWDEVVVAHSQYARDTQENHER
jgi:hypothetical protein